MKIKLQPLKSAGVDELFEVIITSDDVEKRKPAPDTPFDSELKMNHLDVALFYGLPFVKSGTADVLNIDLGFG